MSEQSDPQREQHPVTQSLLAAAREICTRVEIRAIVGYADIFPDSEAVAEFLEDTGDVKLILATRDEGAYDEVCAPVGATTLRVPNVRLTRTGQIKVAILLAVSRGLIGRGDRVLCLSGVAGSKVVDALFVAEVSAEVELFEATGAEEIPSHVRTEVFERVLDLAVSLGIEGREGRPVGTIFVLGDTEEVLRHSEQLILNPFRGYPEDERNILDPGLTETIKEYATLDGAFVIRDDGVVECAGRFLRSTIPGRPLPSGLGARHQSAAAATAATSAVAIAISESTGNVTIFEKGRILFEIERPRPLGPQAPADGHLYGRDAEREQEDT